MKEAANSGGLIEGNSNPLFVSPSDMATAHKIVAFNEKCKSGRDSLWTFYLYTRPGRGEIADHAAEATTIIENDDSRFQRSTVRSSSTFCHGYEAKAPGFSSRCLHIPNVH